MQINELFVNGTITPNWAKILSIPCFAALEGCKQSKVWHKEGNVLEHTKLVTEQMAKYLNTKDVSTFDERPYYPLLMMAAAICHDIGKPDTTYFDKTDDDYHCKDHGKVGERIVREIFFDEENITNRERLCYMVRNHMLFHNLIRKSNDIISKKIVNLSLGIDGVTVDDMVALFYCDSMGSINEETEEIINNRVNTYKFFANIKLFDCLHNPSKVFEPRCQYRDKNFKMYVMIGAPGSGKNYYIGKYLAHKDIVSISRDDIRAEIGVDGMKNGKANGTQSQESKVTKIFNDRVIECCKNKQSFVLNNTNVKRKYRDEYRKIVETYNPEIIYVYCEAPTIEECKKRREGMMPLEVIDKMYENLEFPTMDEYHVILWFKQHKNDNN